MATEYNSSFQRVPLTSGQGQAGWGFLYGTSQALDYAFNAQIRCL